MEATATVPEKIQPTRGAPARNAIWAAPRRIAAIELLKRISLWSSVFAFRFCFANRCDPIKKMRLPFLPNRAAKRIIIKSAVVTIGCWNTIAAVTPVSSTARFSVTIGNGIPSKGVDDDNDVVDIIVLFVC